MSSLAASRADNFYFPPDFDPNQGSLNAQQGTHALGKRAKHIDKGIITVRYAT
jgi:coiled-coil domain-containing protein 130